MVLSVLLIVPLADSRGHLQQPMSEKKTFI